MGVSPRIFLGRWLVNTVAVWAAANIVHGISYDGFGALCVVALILAVLKLFVRPFLVVLSLPFLLSTFGLFLLVINACLLYFVGWLVRSFHVAGFSAAFWGALVISVISLILNAVFGLREEPGRAGSRRPPSSKRSGQGPVIDV
jgi:putative membrane protein